MANSQTRAKSKYNKTNYFTTTVSFPKRFEDGIRKAAAEMDISVNRLVSESIRSFLESGHAEMSETDEAAERLRRENLELAEKLEKSKEAYIRMLDRYREMRDMVDELQNELDECRKASLLKRVFGKQ